MSSLATVPSVSRFDLLLGEQISQVKNSQEGLQQSLAMLHKTGSKEEQESARGKVKLLMSSARELVTVLQALMEIRKELTIAQKDLMEARTSQKSCENEYDRVRWLEQRLEKLLMAHRRGRPAARGHRQPHITRFSHQRNMPNNSILPEGVDEVALLEAHTNSPMGEWSAATVGSPHPKPVSSPTKRSGRTRRSVEQSANVSKVLYGFEYPRPVEVFGPSSWSALSLSVNTNYMDTCPSEVSATQEIISVNASLESVCSEFLCLQRLIKGAARAATVEGTLLPAIPSQASLSQANSLLPGILTVVNGSDSLTMNTAAEVTPTTCTGETVVARMRSLPELCSVPISHKACRKKVHMSVLDEFSVLCQEIEVANNHSGTTTFPRSAATWCPARQMSSPKYRRAQSMDLDLEPSHNNMRGALRRVRSKSALNASTQPSKLTNDFDVDKHRTQQINFLLERLESAVTANRRNAAQAIGNLKCKDTLQIQHLLTCKLLQDCDMTVKYFGLKSLLTLGIVDTAVQEMTNRILSEGSPSVQCDILQLIANLQQKNRSFEWGWCHGSLVPLLCSSHSEVALLSACVLSHCHLERERCVATLLPQLTSTTCTHRNQALQCLVECWQLKTAEVVSAALSQMQGCSDWKMRLSAIQLLKTIGKDIVSVQKDIFNVLIQRISNEPIQAVKQAIGWLLTELNMEKKAQKLLLERLESADETTRAEAAIALRAFDLRSPRIAQVMLDYFELDSSSYVRIQLVRTLGLVKSCSPEVMQRLAEKCKGSGMVARECKIILNAMKKSLGFLDEE